MIRNLHLRPDTRLVRTAGTCSLHGSRSCGTPIWFCESYDSGKKRKYSSRDMSEEDIAAYVNARKARKKAMRVAKKLKSPIVGGYSNASNPFGDPNLSEIFVWKKKIEWDVAQGATLYEFSVKVEKEETQGESGED
ncbi:hypothetical protein CDL15_Pgr022032 [Punica granatum]|uniref:Uncharacterized protein n=1 Tax=Punica granatum TaxID=22663 RepID=A0A218VRX9_PUNGR|nr:hypothetical protein CDL15_Pgr022032 [Punica granatum]